MRKTSGFTLIELLIVMAILTLLAGILFTVFAGVKEKARQTHCMNNLKQLGAAILLYKQDYDGGWPPVITAVYGPYVRDKAVLVCPDDGGERCAVPPESVYSSYQQGPGADCLPFLSGMVLGRMPDSEDAYVGILAIVQYGRGLPILQCFHHLRPGAKLPTHAFGTSLQESDVHSCLLRLEQDGSVRHRLVPEQIGYFDVFDLRAQAGMSWDEYNKACKRIRDQLRVNSL
jgi:prepilin-type N-terminal cleavage/methylation domain-containing protein